MNTAQYLSACGRMLFVFAIWKYLHCSNQEIRDSEGTGEYSCNAGEEAGEISIYVAHLGSNQNITLVRMDGHVVTLITQVTLFPTSTFMHIIP